MPTGLNRVSNSFGSSHGVIFPVNFKYEYALTLYNASIISAVNSLLRFKNRLTSRPIDLQFIRTTITKLDLTMYTLRNLVTHD